MIYDGNFDILFWASVYKHLKANIRVISDLGHLSKYFFSKKSQFYNLMCQHRPAATHLVSKPFDPRLPLPLDKWSQNFGPPGQMVPIQFGPHGKMVPRISLSSRRTGCGDPEIRGPFVQGDQILGDHLSRGTKFSGTICPGGPNLMGTICPGGSI